MEPTIESNVQPHDFGWGYKWFGRWRFDWDGKLYAFHGQYKEEPTKETLKADAFAIWQQITKIPQRTSLR